MSFDLRICVKVEGWGDFVPFSYPELDSPTYNLGTMFRKCMGWDFEQGEHYNCSEIIKYIDAGINELTFHRERYEQYNPPNGWGNLDGALDVLRSLKQCINDNAEYIPIEYLYMAW